MTAEMPTRQALALGRFIAEAEEVLHVRYDGSSLVVTGFDGEWRIDSRGDAEHLVGPVIAGKTFDFRAAAREGGRKWGVQYRRGDESWSTLPRRFPDQKTAEDFIREEKAR